MSAIERRLALLEQAATVAAVAHFRAYWTRPDRSRGHARASALMGREATPEAAAAYWRALEGDERRRADTLAEAVEVLLDEDAAPAQRAGPLARLAPLLDLPPEAAPSRVIETLTRRLTDRDTRDDRGTLPGTDT